MLHNPATQATTSHMSSEISPAAVAAYKEATSGKQPAEFVGAIVNTLRILDKLGHVVIEPDHFSAASSAPNEDGNLDSITFKFRRDHLPFGQQKTNTVVLESTPDGAWTWTIPQMISRALGELEQAFGPRTKSPTAFVGYDFAKGGPHISYYNDGLDIVIRLSLGSHDSAFCAAFEVAHECTHLFFGQVKGRTANNLEEGLASLFARDFCRKHFSGHSPSAGAAYAKPLSETIALIEQYPNVIRELRGEWPSISDLPNEILKERYPLVDAEAAAYLTKPFTKE